MDEIAVCSQHMAQAFFDLPTGSREITSGIRETVPCIYCENPATRRVRTARNESLEGDADELGELYDMPKHQRKWMLGYCSDYATALHKQRPDTKFGMWVVKDNTEGYEGYEPSHVFIHDEKHAYDAAGVHPLPYDPPSTHSHLTSIYDLDEGDITGQWGESDPDLESDAFQHWQEHYGKKTAMPRDEQFLSEVEYKHHEFPDSWNMLEALHKGRKVGEISWAGNPENAKFPSNGEKPEVDNIHVEPHYQRHGLGSELWDRALKIEPTLQHSYSLTPDGEKWVKNLDPEGAEHVKQMHDMEDHVMNMEHPEEKYGQVQRYCVKCKKEFSESEGGEATGFCQACREKEGMVTHHTWSQDSLRGHYGAKGEVWYSHTPGMFGGGRIEAWKGKNRVGYLEHAEDGFVQNIEVIPSHRHQGVATGMTNYLKEKVGLEPGFEKKANARGHAILSIGIPGSGKSTVMKPYASAIDAPYVSSDGIRKEITGDEADISQDEKVWPLLYQRVHQALDETGKVVVDATSSNYEKRLDLLNHLRQKAGTIDGVYFDIPLDLALERNDNRDRQVPPEVIKNMHQQLQEHPPSEEDGFDSISRMGNLEKTASKTGIPSAPGTVPIPEGHVRIYHSTLANPEDIQSGGLLMEKARDSYSKGATEFPAIFGYAGHHPVLDNHESGGGANVVEFHLPLSDLDIGNNSTSADLEGRRNTVTTMKDVLPENIIAVHEPWHAVYRHINEDPKIKDAVLAGEHDWALDEPDFALGEAVRRIKQESLD